MKSVTPAKATEAQLAAMLDTLRLERRWSFRQLGEEIGTALEVAPIPEPTVRKFIQHGGDRGFLDTTVYPFRKYLQQLHDAGLLEPVTK